MMRILVDEENSAEQWWDAARRHINTAPRGFRDFIVGDRPMNHALIATYDETAEFLIWASTLPGWNTGPAYAPTPLIVQEVQS